MTTTTTMMHTDALNGAIEAQNAQKEDAPRQFILRTSPNKYKPDPNQWGLYEVRSVIAKWTNRSEVWPFNWGIGSLALTSAATSTYINWHFRNTLYLLGNNRTLSYVVMFGIPAATAAGLHFMIVTRHILEAKPKACSSCLQIKGMTVQASTGMLYPLVLVPTLAYPIAKRLGSYTVPNLKVNDPMPIIRFTREMLRPIKGQLWALTALQVLLGLGITYAEQHHYDTYMAPYLKAKGAPLSPYDNRNVLVLPNKAE